MFFLCKQCQPDRKFYMVREGNRFELRQYKDEPGNGNLSVSCPCIKLGIHPLGVLYQKYRSARVEHIQVTDQVSEQILPYLYVNKTCPFYIEFMVGQNGVGDLDQQFEL